MDAGRFFSPFEEDHRRNVIVLGYTVGQTLFPAVDALGKKVRLNQEEFTVVGVMGKRPSPLGGDPNAFAVIPATTYDKVFEVPRIRGLLMRFLFVGVVGYPNAPREQLLSEVQEVMRSRHRLKVDQENDFDIVTSDMIMGIFDQFTRAIFLALVVISSIALMVGGIGVMAIMTISVTERTREIGIRKALGARRREILWQFLLEAVFLTSIGGLLGIALGSAIGLIVHFAAGFPVSLPWWSFAIGIGFSASVGIFFGLWPAFKASRLDPIEALRYE
jgi:putative ABC transport system permease protein